ncbi:MAG: hypothetical protein K0Q66_594 [Chitinophagaceae bacterium]|jgi:hypothetical protein|nr:hypothetical protein [Chitinophagaceae bacterium]
MKIIIAFILSFISVGALAQQNVFKVSAQKQIITVHLNEDNTNKKITVNSKEKIANVQRLTIRGLAPEQDNGFVRTFQIVPLNQSDALVSFTDDKEPGVFNYGLKDLTDKLNPGTYQIFTIAIPNDPAKAAASPSKRILIATLEVV